MILRATNAAHELVVGLVDPAHRPRAEAVEDHVFADDQAVRLAAEEASDLIIGQDTVADQPLGEGPGLGGEIAGEDAGPDVEELLLGQGAGVPDDRQEVGGHGFGRLRLVGSRHGVKLLGTRHPPPVRDRRIGAPAVAAVAAGRAGPIIRQSRGAIHAQSSSPTQVIERPRLRPGGAPVAPDRRRGGAGPLGPGPARVGCRIRSPGRSASGRAGGPAARGPGPGSASGSGSGRPPESGAGAGRRRGSGSP